MRWLFLLLIIPLVYLFIRVQWWSARQQLPHVVDLRPDDCPHKWNPVLGDQDCEEKLKDMKVEWFECCNFVDPYWCTAWKAEVHETTGFKRHLATVLSVSTKRISRYILSRWENGKNR